MTITVGTFVLFDAQMTVNMRFMLILFIAKEREREI